MAKNILEKIIDNRIKEIEYRKKLISMEVLERNIIEYESMYERKFYDFKNDFNLAEDIGKEFQVSSSGVINKSEELNKISFEVKNSSFKYRLLANKFKSGEGQPTDIGCNVQARRLDQ